VILVYIAGAYSGANLAQITRHVDESRTVALDLAARRIPFLSTVLQTAHFELLLGRRDPGYDHWIDVSLEVLKRCDAIFLVPNWKDSPGANREVHFARELGIPVFEDIEMLTDWANQR
jgi:hypothetical protein